MGLGNPGPRYAGTRHNIGFELVDYAAAAWGDPGTWKQECKALTRKVNVAGEPVLLAKPQTFMNLSGESARALLAFYKLPPEKLTVVFDDVYLDLGAVRIRSQGSAGGHNGIKSIIQHCGTEFARIRIGVGPCPPGCDLSNFVLQNFSRTEGEILKDLGEYFLDAARLGLSQGWEAAASRFNRRLP